MGKFFLLAVLFSQFCLLESQAEDETNAKVSGNANPVLIKENTLLPLLLELASEEDEKKGDIVSRLAQTGDPRLEKFFELYRQGSVYNWPDAEGNPRIVVNEETVMDDDFNVWLLASVSLHD